MPSQLRGHCLDCGHEWEGLHWWIACGPVDILKPEVNYSPLDDDEIRRVILHLKALAGHHEEPRLEKVLVLASPQSQGALWDQELDGWNGSV